MVTEECPGGLSQLVAELQGSYGHAILVLFYVDTIMGSMVEDDVVSLYRELRRVGWNRQTPLSTLDVIIHTSGGDPELVIGWHKLLETPHRASPCWCRNTPIALARFYVLGQIILF